MRRFEILEPKSIEEACNILSNKEDAKLIAGGTALLILIKQGLFVPKTLVNLKKLNGAAGVTYSPKDGLRIGGLTTIYEVETALEVRQHYPLLAQACHVVANIRIRNMATIGGNLAHADYQSDPPAALIALNASVELTRRAGVRRKSLAEFLLGAYETALEPDEILTAVVVPPPFDTRSMYMKFTTRSSEDRPCAGVAAVVRRMNGICEEVRVVVGAVSPVPVALATDGLVQGKPLTSELIETIGNKASASVDPIDDLRGTADYKRELVRVLVRRALTRCAREEVD